MTDEDKKVSKRLTVVIKDDLVDKLEEVAAREGLSPQAAMLKALMLYCHVSRETADGRRQPALFDRETKTVILISFVRAPGDKLVN